MSDYVIHYMKIFMNTALYFLGYSKKISTEFFALSPLKVCDTRHGLDLQLTVISGAYKGIQECLTETSKYKVSSVVNIECNVNQTIITSILDAATVAFLPLHN